MKLVGKFKSSRVIGPPMRMKEMQSAHAYKLLQLAL